MKKCLYCDQHFQPSKFTPHQLYCSDDCRREHYRHTRKQWRRQYRRAYYAKHHR